MSSKLRNVQAIQQMLQGTHKTQTRKTFGFSDVKNSVELNKKRKVGERWTDANGDEWEQRQGFRNKNPRQGEMLVELRKLFELPDTCPDCGNPMGSRLDKKMYPIHKKCFDCVVVMETKMRYNGTYEDYARNKIKANVLAWLKDTDNEVIAFKKSLENQIEYVNGDGSVEKWSMPNKKKTLKRIDADYKRFKDDLLKGLETKNETNKDITNN